jgi:DNA-binding NarL/FixJ family response regulator
MQRRVLSEAERRAERRALRILHPHLHATAAPSGALASKRTLFRDDHWRREHWRVWRLWRKGHTQKEIAEKLEITPAAVFMRMRKVRMFIEDMTSVKIRLTTK